MQKVEESPEAEYAKQPNQIFCNYSAKTFLINMHYFICQEREWKEEEGTMKTSRNVCALTELRWK
jgi:hypothetical protein